MSVALEYEEVNVVTTFDVAEHVDELILSAYALGLTHTVECLLELRSKVFQRPLVYHDLQFSHGS